jgi:hypothetical protein
MRRSALTIVVFAVISIHAHGQKATKSTDIKDSLIFSCLGKTALSVEAMTSRHVGFPEVQLTLTDPQGRTAGEDSRGDRIPGSRYSRIFGTPKPHKEYSKSRAVEVCNAEQGIYQLTLHEVANESYLINAMGTGDVDVEGGITLYHVGKPGRVRHYRFSFSIKDRKLEMNWLDGEGREQLIIEPPEW